MDIIKKIEEELENSISTTSEKLSRYFKTNKGSYAENDIFIGIKAPDIRKIAQKHFFNINFDEVKYFLHSKINEKRAFALIILCEKYKKCSNEIVRKEIYEFYLSNREYINNWNLVDISAHKIIGAYLFDKDKSILKQLSSSEILWDRRISIVSTWFFIMNNQTEYTFEIAKNLINDKEDLIHKASGWMLREAGKKDINKLKTFIEKNCYSMPRTMLRYSIEKFPQNEKQNYMSLPSIYI